MIKVITVIANNVINTIKAPKPIIENNAVTAPINTPTANTNNKENIAIIIDKQQQLFLSLLQFILTCGSI